MAVRVPLSRERVVAAALDVADAEGVEAVTMRRLAEELGVHPTSLYNHLPTKEAILDAMADALVGEADLPDTFDAWPDWVRAMAAGMRSVARTHPGAFLVLVQRAATGPAASEVTEAALDAFRRGGFTAHQSAEAVSAVSLAMLGVALNECPPTAPLAEPNLTAVDAEQFPRIAEAMAAVPKSATLDGVWQLVVDGLIASLNARVSAPVPASRASAHRRARPARR